VPHDRKIAIREELVAAQQRLLQTLDGLTAEDWARLSPNEGWTVRDLLTHLTTSETGFVSGLRRMAAGEGGVPADFDPDRWNASQLRRRGDSAPDQLLGEITASHADMLALLDTLDDVALDQRGYLSTGGEGSTEDNFRLVASHKRSHTEDIRAALAVTPRRGL
jgi:uncharacterized protein (TIGR03083 family)